MKINLLNKLLVIGTIIIVMMLPSFSLATNNLEEGVVSLKEENYESASAFHDQINQVLSDPDIEEVRVIFDDESIIVHSMTQDQSSEIKPRTTSPVYYNVKNVKKGADYYGTTNLGFAEGRPGDYIGVASTKSISTTISGTLGASSKSISAAVGWSITGSTSITIDGHATVPKTHNKKKVKSMRYNAYAVYKVKYFDVYRYVPGYINKKLGTKNTKKAYGVTFKKTYKYK